MKLLIITAITAFETQIKEMLEKANVKIFNYQEVTGFKDISEESFENNWFGTEMNKTDSMLYYAFVKKEEVDLLFDLVNDFNRKQEIKSKIHIAVLNIEKIN